MITPFRFFHFLTSSSVLLFQCIHSFSQVESAPLLSPKSLSVSSRVRRSFYETKSFHGNDFFHHPIPPSNSPWSRIPLLCALLRVRPNVPAPTFKVSFHPSAYWTAIWLIMRWYHFYHCKFRNDSAYVVSNEHWVHFIVANLVAIKLLKLQFGYALYNEFA